jgi:FkbM family methyltransferase
MVKRKSASLAIGVYGLARAAGLPKAKWFRRLYVASYFAYKRTIEDPFRWLVCDWSELFRGGDVLDIGANIGYTASVFAGAIDEGCRVYAFEPDRATFDLLNEVVRRKNLAAVNPVRSAVGRAEGEVQFWHNQEHSADHRVVTDRFRSAGIDQRQVESVPLTSIDAFVAARGITRLAFVKIDVQGYELAVCEGMTQTLERFPNACVAFEYAPESMVELGYAPEQLLEFFQSRKFHMHVLAKRTLRAANDPAVIRDAAASLGYVDVLCSRRALF